MNNSATMEKMKELKLNGMKIAFEVVLKTGQMSNFTNDEFVAHLIEEEWNHKKNNKLIRAVKNAKLRYNTAIEEIDFNTQRNLDKNQILRISECLFIKKKENLIITGPTGVGKSYLASAIGNQACIKDFKVKYFNMTRLLTTLAMSKADNSYLKKLEQIKKIDLLILDDFGLQPIAEKDRISLLEIIEDRYKEKSTLILSQIPIKEWYELIGENTIADAIMDRVLHNAHRVELKGESMRKRMAKKLDY